MVLEHISQHTGPVIIFCPVPDIDVFGDRNLDIIHVITVPDRFHDRVSKPEKKDILGGFFAQIMVDPVNLFFFKNLVDRPVSS